MPHTDLLFNRVEHEDLVRFIFEKGAWLVPSHLAAPDLTQIRDIASYRTHVDSREKLFHIQHRDFERAPLEVRHVRSAEGRDVFYVVAGYGGPTVDLLGPYDFDEGGVARVAGGFISHYPTFWNTLTQSRDPAPPEQKAFYGTLVRHIKSSAVKTKAGKRTYWVGMSTAARFRDGLVALPEGWTVPIEIP
jgi:hypothetical protein